MYLVTIGVAVGIGLWLYGRLLERLRVHHPEEFRAAGAPELWMRSPSRGLSLQRFIYGAGFRHSDPVLRRWCRIAAAFVPMLLVVLLLEMVWLAGALGETL